MRGLIESVEIGTYYEGRIYDFWINILLKSGRKIKIFDYELHDLRKYVGKEIQLIVSAFMIGDINQRLDNAKMYFLGKCTQREVPFPNFQFIYFETADCKFLVDPDEFSEQQFKKEEVYSFTVGRFDLRGILS
jgi:hypothetical protein